MSFKKIIAAIVTAAMLYGANAHAVGTLIPAANRVDMVHDAARSVVYITAGGSVLRYHVPSATFLPPIVLGGSLTGIDISPDGSTLAVADQSISVTEQWIYLVRLADLAVTKAAVTRDEAEGGFWAVAFGVDGTVFTTSGYQGSGWVPMRRFNPATATWSRLGAAYPENTFAQNGMVSASGDGKVIAFVESNNSAGPWGRFDILSGQLKRFTDYQTGTSAFNFEMATNSNGSQYAIPTYHGTYIYNSAYAKVATIGQNAGQQPIGVAYHPVESRLYFPWAQTREVRVYDAATFTQVGSYDFEDNFVTTGNGAFVRGRTRLSKDGSLLMVSVTGGVRILQTYAPLAAAPVTGSTNNETPLTLPLKGSIGNGGTLSYALASNPLHGTAVVSGSNVTYTPAAGFGGTDSFNYVAVYGGASATASAAVKVDRVNHPPVAVADSASTLRGVQVVIPVLANDSDPDGDPLTITMVTAPAGSTAAIRGGNIIFTPARNAVEVALLTYTISDGHGGSASAQVRVKIIKRS